MTESEILLKLKSGDKFTGRNGAFTGIVAPLSFHGDNMIVECRKDGCTWKEDWDVLTTVWGFENGDYEFISMLYFESILDSNKDVLKRIKEKGD